SATSAAPRASSSPWPSRSADASLPRDSGRPPTGVRGRSPQPPGHIQPSRLKLNGTSGRRRARRVPDGPVNAGGSGLLLKGLEGGQAEWVPGRVGVDVAVAVWLEVVLRGAGR